MTTDQARNWTIKELMKASIEYLEGKNFTEARLNVELLLSYALSVPRIKLYMEFDKPVKPDELKKFRSLFERRLKREPIQYITGEAHFMGLRFTVEPGVLIPRPETETLVERAILKCKQYPEADPISVLDIGTGSGVIAVSIAKFVPKVFVVALDIDPASLQVALRNAEVQGVADRITFVEADIFHDCSRVLKRRFNLIVSNPPYVPSDEFPGLQKEISAFEPPVAVTDGGDGLRFYRRIAEIAPSFLYPAGWVMVECGMGQDGEVSGIFGSAGFSSLETVKDLMGVDRVVIGTCSPLYSGGMA